MDEIKCPHNLNQFLLGEPIFENTFLDEECEEKKFYGDCYHCWATSIAKRDNQLPSVTQPCKDAISRQAAIEAIKTYWSKMYYPKIDGYIKCLEQLPNVSSERPKGQMKVYVVTEIYDNQEPVVTVWNNESAAAQQLDYLKRNKIKCCIDECYVYSKFTVYEENTISEERSEDKCKNCEYYLNPDYTRCHECGAESEVKDGNVD